MNELDDRLKSHYERLRLPDRHVEALLLATDEAHDAMPTARGERDISKPSAESEPGPRRHGGRVFTAVSGLKGHIVSRMGGWRALQAVAALLLMGVVAVFMHGNGSLAERRSHMVKEIAMNHGTRFDMEFRGESLASIDENMRLLPFSLTLPSRLASDVQVVGSRYCSLAGKLAAHVRLVDRKSGKPLSLFVTAMVDDLEPMQPQASSLRGVDVELWREGGLFFALANQS